MASEKVLAPNGRLVVISYHSLEDRIMNKFMKRCTKHEIPTFTKINGVVVPTREEIDENIRARSAKMRILERNENPFIEEEFKFIV
jgi:16S rRNA (cytosine1402-N4)-methyltransferase